MLDEVLMEVEVLVNIVVGGRRETCRYIGKE